MKNLCHLGVVKPVWHPACPWFGEGLGLLNFFDGGVGIGMMIESLGHL